MSSENTGLNVVKNYLKRYKIGTLDQLKKELFTSSTMTVFRKLKSLKYLSSYSHRGKYYTLNFIPEFDETGLWSFNSIWFSKYGNLIETTREFVDQSKAGFSAQELGQILNVEVKHPLLALFTKNQVSRKKFSNIFIYFSPSRSKRLQQITLRKSSDSLAEFNQYYEIDVFRDELKTAIILFYSLLNEKQRRLYAGLESFKLGHGGDKKIADLLGLDSHTIAKGRRELLGGNIQTESVREKGGGRKPVEKKFQKSSTKSKKS
ncbi:MAG: hypothetical protein PF690_01430 [Deltaproteobacteria bacterium]|jgi:hypothetical protein|nr:hypothetical protein [Deltaproteobacteria bacterium]